MSRIKLIFDVIEDIRSLGDSLQVLADAMADEDTEKVPKKKSKAKTKSEIVKEETTTPAKAESKSITLEEVRAVLVEKAREGFTDEVKSLITKHGAERLSDIEPLKYETIIAEAEEIGNA